MPDNFKWWLQAINASMTKQAKKPATKGIFIRNGKKMLVK